MGGSRGGGAGGPPIAAQGRSIQLSVKYIDDLKNMSGPHMDTPRSSWKMAYVPLHVLGNTGIISKVFQLINRTYKIANSADPAEMQHSVAFHQGIHCLPASHFRTLDISVGFDVADLYKVIDNLYK